MTCAKISCGKSEDEVAQASIAGVTVYACKNHLDGMSRDRNIAELFARQTKLGRQYQVLMEALRGPAANIDRALAKLDELVDAEYNTQQAVLDWLRTASGGRPS